MLKMQASFAGSFGLDCQVRSMPHSLSAMVAMILNGPNIKSQGCDGVSQASVLPSCSSITSLFVNSQLCNKGRCHIDVKRRPYTHLKKFLCQLVEI